MIQIATSPNKAHADDKASWLMKKSIKIVTAKIKQRVKSIVN